MKPEDHKKRSEEIRKSLEKLLPDESGEHVVAIVELCYGISQHITRIVMLAYLKL